jgi:hypothetical protein
VIDRSRVMWKANSSSPCPSTTVPAPRRAPLELDMQCLGGISKMPTRRDQARLAFSNAWKIR